MKLDSYIQPCQCQTEDYTALSKDGTVLYNYQVHLNFIFIYKKVFYIKKKKYHVAVLVKTAIKVSSFEGKLRPSNLFMSTS